MRKIYLSFTPIALAAGFGLAAQSAFAQSAPGSGGTSPTGAIAAPQLQPKGTADAPLPPAVPGAGDQNLPTSQSVANQQSGDPTAELFTAINGNKYGLAQDAISRGADLNAQNSLGETPIDLSVALNRNSITFMLLAARNDSGDDSSADSAGAAAGSSMPQHSAPNAKPRPVPVKLIERPTPAASENTGTPDSSAGFLGFNH